MPKAREGGEHEREINPPLVRGVCGGLPRELFWILSASMCVFNGGLCVWDQILVVLVTKIFLVARVRNRMLDKIVFRQSHVFFLLFFLQYVTLTLFHLCTRRF